MEKKLQTPTKTRFWCGFSGHKPVKAFWSDLLVHEKGNRNIAVFSGRISICPCGNQEYTGNRVPWFEGTMEDLMELQRKISEAAPNIGGSNAARN